MGHYPNTALKTQKKKNFGAGEWPKLFRDKKKGEFTKVSKLDLKDGQSIQVWMKGLDFALQLIKKIFINEDGSTGTLYLVSNDLLRTPQNIK